MIDKVMKFSTEKNNIFFTSDTHFGHNKEFLYRKRNFNNVFEHDEKLIEGINSVHTKDTDILFHMGDFCLTIDYERFDSILDRIKFKTIYYIWGNHNSRIKEAYKQSLIDENIEMYPTIYKNIVFLGYYKEICIDKQNIVLSHYPIDVWNNCKKNWWHLCGHSHYHNPRTRVESVNGKCLDVGVDGQFTPYSFKQIKDIMLHKKHISVDNLH